MPIEGVSFQNAGFHQINPTEVNVQTEAIAKSEAQKKIKEPNKSDKTKADSEENENQERDLQGRDSGDKESENNFENPENFLQDSKKFKVKFNSSTEMVEMIDVSSGDVVETVSPEDLINILSNSKAFSGILVDRKI